MGLRVLGMYVDVCVFFRASCPFSTDPNPLGPTDVEPLSLVTQAGNCLVPRFQDRPARGKVPPPAEDSGAVTFQSVNLVWQAG